MDENQFGLKEALISQYQAALKMLVKAIDTCPDEIWDAGGFKSTYWKNVYHTLHYTALYLSPSVKDYQPWSHHRKESLDLESTSKPVEQQVYSKTEMRNLAQNLASTCARCVNEDDFSRESGFPWLLFNRLQLHLYNIRHIQHHVGQLFERLHDQRIYGLGWVKKGDD